MKRDESCPYCYEGEIGYPPTADLCPACKGSGVATEIKPRFVPDNRAEAEGTR